MPPTIESRLAAHHAARERHIADLHPWAYRLQIKHLLSDDSSDETARATGKQVAALLQASTWAKADQAEADAHGMDSEVAMCAEEFEDIEDLDHFNAVLDQLYILADADRTWIS